MCVPVGRNFGKPSLNSAYHTSNRDEASLRLPHDKMVANEVLCIPLMGTPVSHPAEG